MSEFTTGGDQPVNRPEPGSITHIEQSQYRSGIPLRGWEGVKMALGAFVGGAMKGSPATMGGVRMPHLRKKEGDLAVSKLLQEAQPVVDSKGVWSRHYDYDDVIYDGRNIPFFKTIVEIQRAHGGDDYILRLSVDYEGDETEKSLAEYLEVERGMAWKRVTVKFQPEGDRFKIDFDQVADRLKNVVATLNPPEKRKKGREVTGRDIVEQLMSVGSAMSFALGTKDGLEVTLVLNVGRRFELEGGKLEDKFFADGAVLTGPLATAYVNYHLYPDKIKFTAPSIQISITPEGRLTEVDPRGKIAMSSLQSEVADAFSPK